jgi:hypothetical protein
MGVPGQAWHDGVFLVSLIRRDCGVGGEGGVDQTTPYIPLYRYSVMIVHRYPVSARHGFETTADGNASPGVTIVVLPVVVTIQRIIFFSLVASAILEAVYCYPVIPDTVASHLNAAGSPNG